MKTLVIGGTGTVGSQVVNKLLSANHEVSVLTTSSEKAAKLPQGVKAYIGSLEYQESLSAAFKDVDNVFMLNAHTQTEVYQGLNAIAEAVANGVKRFVYQSIHQARNGDFIDHFKSKVMIEKALFNSGLNYVIIAPNNFYQNDFWYKESVTRYQLYNQPIGAVGLSRVDVRDIAEAVVKVLETDKYDRKTIALAGPEALTGESTAQTLTEVLGYPVTYIGNDLKVFRDAFSNWVPAWMLEDWAEMYQFFQDKGLRATEQELADLRELLGREPISYKEFLTEHINVFAA